MCTAAPLLALAGFLKVHAIKAKMDADQIARLCEVFASKLDLEQVAPASPTPPETEAQAEAEAEPKQAPAPAPEPEPEPEPSP